MAKKMKILTGISLLLFLIFVVLYLLLRIDVFLTFCITFGVFFYHFAMRLGVGGAVHGIFHNKMDYHKWWFRPRSFEKRLYACLKVRKWRRHVPTYAPETFSTAVHSWEEIAQATCQAEVVHEIIMLLSFLPILLAIPFGALAVFAVTSLFAALFDAIFVILQRYNRPMIVKVLKRMKQADESDQLTYTHATGCRISQRRI